MIVILHQAFDRGKGSYLCPVRDDMACMGIYPQEPSCTAYQQPCEAGLIQEHQPEVHRTRS